jgi:hypothetical protein
MCYILLFLLPVYMLLSLIFSSWSMEAFAYDQRSKLLYHHVIRCIYTYSFYCQLPFLSFFQPLSIIVIIFLFFDYSQIFQPLLIYFSSHLTSYLELPCHDLPIGHSLLKRGIVDEYHNKILILTLTRKQESILLLPHHCLVHNTVVLRLEIILFPPRIILEGRAAFFLGHKF